MKYLAHEGEIHEDQIESTLHILDNELIVIPVFLIFIVLLSLIMRSVFKLTSDKIALSLLPIFLVLGLFGYKYAPSVAIISITMGISLALIYVLSSVSGKPRN